MSISKFISTLAAIAAVAGSFIVASPAFANSMYCSDRGCRYNFTSSQHRYYDRGAYSRRAASQAAADAATAAVVAHYVYENLDD